MLRVRFTADAQADLNNALNWYETYAPEIASQFRNALRVVVARITENPRQFTPLPIKRAGRFSAAFPILCFFAKLMQRSMWSRCFTQVVTRPLGEDEPPKRFRSLRRRA